MTKPLKPRRMKVIISGGGTGGHIYPAIAIAEALVARIPAVDILFVGASDRMEMGIIPQYGYKIKGLWIAGFQRRLTLKNLLFPVKLIWSWFQAKNILNEFKPDAVVGVGGYASGPMVRAAIDANIPSMIQEQNSYAGITNQILGKKVTKICVAYPNMDKFFPGNKIIVTGNPIRKDIQNKILDAVSAHRSDACDYFGLSPHKMTIVSMGGSLGARALNEAISDGYETIKNNPEVQWIWQTGKVNFDLYKDSPTAKLTNVKIYPFFEKMEYVYGASDLIISRAGALSVAEICLAGKAAILVPSPNVAEDHQTKNALALVEEQAAILVKEQEISSLIEKALSTVNDKNKLEDLARNSKKLAKPKAASDIAEQIISLVNSGKR